MSKKTDPRHETRRLAMGVLFSWSFYSTDLDLLVESVSEQMGIGKCDSSRARKIVDGVTENLEEIDKIIESHAPEWPIAQIAKIDLVSLRIAIFELYLDDKTPEKVVIDEAIELAKEFGGDASGSFVNGVLGMVVKNLPPRKKES